MANRFYDPGEQRAAKVHELFSRIAPRYDLINDLQSLGLHRLWKRRVVRLARVQPGQRALDLCCGTGDLALGLAARGAFATALDFSERMLVFAAARSSRLDGHGPGGAGPAPRENSPNGLVHGAPEPNRSGGSSERRSSAIPRVSGALRSRRYEVRFVRGDAQRLPFPDGSFDVVTVGYGLRNLPSWEAGLREMLRVAKPGARLLVLDFGKPDNALWRSLYFGYLRAFVPCLGKVFCGDASAYAYILESLKHYPAQRGVAARMTELGMAGVRLINLLGGVMSINYGEKRC